MRAGDQRRIRDELDAIPPPYPPFCGMPDPFMPEWRYTIIVNWLTTHRRRSPGWRLKDFGRQVELWLGPRHICTARRRQ